jgi:hypothetical protein
MISTCPKCDKPVSVPAGVDSSAAVRCPLCSAEYPLGEALTPAPPELIPVALTDVPASAGMTGEAVADATHPHDEPQHDSEGENEAVAVAAEFPITPVPARRRRKPKSALQTLIEVVAGGLAGCLVAYYGLAFYFGPELAARGFPILPLPGIERITSAPSAPDDAKPKPAEKRPTKGKSKAVGHEESTTRSSCSPRQNVIQFG